MADVYNMARLESSLVCFVEMEGILNGLFVGFFFYTFLAVGFPDFWGMLCVFISAIRDRCANGRGRGC